MTETDVVIFSQYVFIMVNTTILSYYYLHSSVAPRCDKKFPSFSTNVVIGQLYVSNLKIVMTKRVTLCFASCNVYALNGLSFPCPVKRMTNPK